MILKIPFTCNTYMDRYHMFCSYSKWKPTYHVIDEDQTGSWSTDNDILSQILKKYGILSDCNKVDKNGIRVILFQERNGEVCNRRRYHSISFWVGCLQYAQQKKVNDEDMNRQEWGLIIGFLFPFSISFIFYVFSTDSTHLIKDSNIK